MKALYQALSLTGALGVALILAVPSAADELPEEIVKAAEADFMTYCAVCHGQSAVGDGPVAKDLVRAPANLRLLAKNNGGVFPEERIYKVIDGREEVMGHGNRDMPIWGSWFKFVARSEGGDVSDDETSEIIVALRIQGMIEYIRTLQQD